MARPNPYYFVFDVESVGLHGEGFAFGYVVLKTEDWSVCEEGLCACLSDSAKGLRDDHDWIEENIPKRIIVEGFPLCQWLLSPCSVRSAFWAEWLKWKERGAWLAADVAWPVEARFLNACIDENQVQRNWQGAYPLVDIASVRLGVGLDPLGTEERLPNEMPAHNPLADARQSARLLLEALKMRKRL